MRFLHSRIDGVVEILPDLHTDARGFFTRIYCPDEFAGAGIDFTPTQMNLSGNGQQRTLRGLHYQNPPFGESKIVRCVQGQAFDVVVDIRPQSATFGHWVGLELDPRRMNAVFMPEGCAHGFLTRQDDTVIQYHMGRSFELGQAKGIRWDDPDLAIDWPAPPAVLSAGDKNWPAFRLVDFS